MTWPTDTPLLADKSAWTRAHRCAEAWATALGEDRIVICEIVRLELLFSGRSAVDVHALDRNLSTRRDLPISRGTLAAARQAMLNLADRGADGYHRVPPTDLVIAACAAEHGCAVLHYDAHYDRLAEVLDFDSVWLVPRGTGDA